jgi:hypothetical protein
MLCITLTSTLQNMKNYGLASFGALLISTASGADLIGLFDDGSSSYSLRAFNSATPTSFTSTSITGLSSGDTIVGFDYRPASGDYVAITATQNVYTINRVSGVATGIGGFSQTVPGSAFGFDFNPAFSGGEFARIISDLDDNRVISGEDGAYLAPIEKTDVFYAGGDVNVGANPNINHIAYTNSLPGAMSTQQYGIDTDLGVLTTVANNAGTLETVGSLGVVAGALGGFDISGLTGEALAAFQNGDGTSSLYSIDLNTGSASLIDSFSGDIVGLTAVPEPSSAGLAGLVAIGTVLMARRRR